MQAKKKKWAIAALLVERTFSLRRHSLLLVLQGHYIQWTRGPGTGDPRP